MSLKEEGAAYIAAILTRQKVASKGRGHNPPAYTLSQLKDWMYENDYNSMYKEYAESGYDMEKCPSIDRIDNSKGYSLDNIRLMTWGEHRYMPRGEYRRFDEEKTFKRISKHEYGERIAECRRFFSDRGIKTYMPLLFWANHKIREDKVVQSRIRRLMTGRITGQDIDSISELELAVDRLKVAGYHIELEK